MSEMTKSPTHYRLLSTFKAIGPYLREQECSKERFLFDCLASCVDDSKSPEEREFWGWWLTLAVVEGGFVAKYHKGRYTLAGTWSEEAVDATAVQEVVKTQVNFHEKLLTALEPFSLSVTLDQESEEFV
ncbi:sigma factor-binding protein Crl [Vibrio agarivorans]|uniref:Sigma factor-binding protein Crl n=1 Tax=Vibrio agarivorans TaxID=153622 RepID=A0ABT7XXH0_9VIBR|nr:sigma factor-binding protein Crl [Vibrio agarivorans]MDN2480478.1 sigma factor-binding protein Crl [Vibrio agarivorans]